MASTNNYPQLVLFDLLTALLDSWTLWNDCAGSAPAGQKWRAQYLKLTYGCGQYVAYESLVAQAAIDTGLGAGAAASLNERWSELALWSGAEASLRAIRPFVKLGIVTNCSVKLGHAAAKRIPIDWDVVVTAEEAGFYKPHIQPYRLALQRAQIEPHQAVFVAGSGYDLFGTAQVGLASYWHNRIGLAAPAGAPAATLVQRDLNGLPDWLASGAWQSALQSV
jgi:2-haloacid dehalogenase